MNKSDLAIELYKFFRVYVHEIDLKNYDTFFLKRKLKNENHIKKLLNKYVNLEDISINPKREHDTLMINYAMVELPTVGLNYTKLFKDFIKKEKQYLKRQQKNVG